MSSGPTVQGRGSGHTGVTWDALATPLALRSTEAHPRASWWHADPEQQVQHDDPLPVWPQPEKDSSITAKCHVSFSASCPSSSHKQILGFLQTPAPSSHFSAGVTVPSGLFAVPREGRGPLPTSLHMQVWPARSVLAPLDQQHHPGAPWRSHLLHTEAHPLAGVQQTPLGETQYNWPALRRTVLWVNNLT